MRGFFRGLTRHWQLKLLAFGLAVLLWVVVSAEQLTSSWISLPFEVQETDPGFQLVAASVPEEVRVRFAGPGRAFLDLALRRPPVLLRIGDVDDVEQVFEVGPSMVRLPDGANVEAYDVDPAFVRLRFRQLAMRDVPVRLRTEGVDRGWAAMAPLQVSPTTVRISGPPGRIAAIASVSTRPAALPSSEEPFRVRVDLDLAGLAGLEVATRTVVVSGRRERVAERRLAAIPVSVGTGVAVRPTQVDLLLRGPRSVVEAAAAAPLRVVVSIDSIPGQVPPGGITVPLRVEGAPPGVSVTLSPATVQLIPLRMMLDSVQLPGGEPAAEGTGDGVAP